ncbi:hypothetical protein MBLNU230_g0324t1 [Neophaeotheca triangularis]
MASAELTTPATTAPTPTPAQTIKIGTRRSLLAQVQAREVERQLKQAWPQHSFEIVAMATTGDNNQTTALHKFNDKALWTQELEALLQKKELSIIVHCLKDMPTQLPADCTIGCITQREDPRDAFVLKGSLRGKYTTLAQLPEGSVVGTSSLRRTAQMKRQFSHLKYADVRGNIGTRLAKLDNPESEYSAIVIAAAGLARLGMSDRITAYLSTENGGMLHAVGQGALAIEIRQEDEGMRTLLAPIGHERTTLAGLAERSLMRTLEGGCSVPIGVETKWVSKSASLASNVGTGVGVGIKPAEDYHQLSGVARPQSSPAQDPLASAGDDHDELTDELVMKAIVCSLDGQEAAEVEMRRRLTNREDADEFGWEVAKALVDRGAAKILEAINLNRGIIHEQGEA